MSQVPFKKIEQFAHQFWSDLELYKVLEDHNRPKYYILDMFPYPSGAGLHVGHPLGYIASDIVARYQRMLGKNVLHPMGFDAFGLPAEQYAILTGQAPQVTTEKNVETYKAQLQKMGLSFDWSREFKTSDSDYYQWTQWSFIKLFHSYFDLREQKAKPIQELVQSLERQGYDPQAPQAHTSEDLNPLSAEEFKKLSRVEREQFLMHFRLAYKAQSLVNWCPELKTVLANDEVSEGLSIRGGHPVVQKKMHQWFLRVSAYATRLLQGLQEIDWPQPLKQIQANWIGESQGAVVHFELQKKSAFMEKISVFTSRIDTLFGVTFLTLAPEHPLVESITTPEQSKAVQNYLDTVINKTEKERMESAKKVSGVFTGAFALHPVTLEPLPIWISEYVLMNYGTGAVMGVAAHDERDKGFAEHFSLEIRPVIDTEDCLVHSQEFTGLHFKAAQKAIVESLAQKGLAQAKTQYRLRDATFSRQRYWGEPIPVAYDEEGVATTLDEDELPLVLAPLQDFRPTEEGEPPLARVSNWKDKRGRQLETSTMPGFAGSCLYQFRYMDPKNSQALVGDEAQNYWSQVDLYLGGSEHATGHLIYSRFMTHFMHDLGKIKVKEPFKKLVNQGMILGTTAFIWRHKKTLIYTSYRLINDDEKSHYTPIRIDINLVKNQKVSIEALKSFRAEYAQANFLTDEDGLISLSFATEKMSKSYFNVVNPDQIIDEYGADAFRLYEMFLGPIVASKPWETEKITGVVKFLQRFYSLFCDESGNLKVQNTTPTPEELKILHRTIKKVREDYEELSFNTTVSALMIACNDLIKLGSHKKLILEPLCQLIAPLAPFLAEFLWNSLGHQKSIFQSSFPNFDPVYLIENTYQYPISFNGKTKFLLELALNLSRLEVEQIILDHPKVKEHLNGQKPKKIIFIPSKIINLVLES